MASWTRSRICVATSISIVSCSMQVAGTARMMPFSG